MMILSDGFWGGLQKKSLFGKLEVLKEDTKIVSIVDFRFNFEQVWFVDGEWIFMLEIRDCK